MNRDEKRADVRQPGARRADAVGDRRRRIPRPTSSSC